MEAAAMEALESSGPRVEGFGGHGSGVILGTTLGGMDILPGLLSKKNAPPDPSNLPYHAVADSLADQLGCEDGSTVSGACASSLMAIGWAAQLVKAGRFQRVLAGGFDGFCEFVHSGFSSLLALDPETVRPFDRERRGLVIGEGAGAVIVEEADHVRAGGRKPLAEIIGYAALSDANHITGPHPQAEGLWRTLESAWKQTGLKKERLDAVHAHGTGTLYNDRMEGIALRRFLGGDAERVRVTASKGAIGHTLGAAGALETVIAVEMLSRDIVLPTVNFSCFDPEVGIRPHTDIRPTRLDIVIKSAAGFGGQNAVLVLKKPA
jgi:3-oxoacyl-(acyl-carrier-protein) synthase